MCCSLLRTFWPGKCTWVLRISVYASFGIPDVHTSKFPLFHMPTAAVAATSEFPDPNLTSPNSQKDETHSKVLKRSCVTYCI